MKNYTIFVHEGNLEKILRQNGKSFREILVDESTHEKFEARVVVSQKKDKAFHNLHLKGRGIFLSGPWYVKIICKM